MPTRTVELAVFTALAACGSEPQAQAPRDGPGAQAPAKAAVCDAARITALGDQLATIDARAQRGLVGVELAGACELPAPLEAFVRAAMGDATSSTDDARDVALRAVCPSAEAALEDGTGAREADRSATLYDRCDLGRFDLIERTTFAAQPGAGVFPFYGYVWLQDQGVDADHARAIARALALLDRRDWALEGQTLPRAPHRLAAVPGGIAIHVAATEIRVEGRPVARFSAPGTIDDVRAHVIAPLFEALTERRTKRKSEGQRGPARAIVIADAGTSVATLADVVHTAHRAGLDRFSFVAESAPLEFGAVPVQDATDGGYDSPSSAAEGIGVAIDAAGFDVYLVHGQARGRVDAARPGAPWDYAALATRVADLLATHADVARATVIATPEIPYDTLLATLATLRGPGCDTGGECLIADIGMGEGALPFAVDTAAARTFDPDQAARDAGIAGLLRDDGRTPHILAIPRDDGTFEARVVPGSESATLGGRGKGVPTVVAGQPTITGPLGKGVVRGVVRAHLAQVRACYNQGLVGNPNLEGTVSLGFTIGSDGAVTSAVVLSSTVADADVGTCIARAATAWTFPKPKGGSVAVTYPFALAPP